MNRAGLSFRAAAAMDVALIHGPGPAAFEQVFAAPGVGDAQAFLRHAFVDGAVGGIGSALVGHPLVARAAVQAGRCSPTWRWRCGYAAAVPASGFRGDRRVSLDAGQCARASAGSLAHAMAGAGLSRR
jgi:hypothetical protein